MVDNSFSSCERLSGWFSLHLACLFGCFILSLSIPICSQLRLRGLCHFAKPLKPEGALNRLSRGPAARENRGLPWQSIVGSFSLLPELPSVADSVAPDACPLVLAAARASPAARHGGVQNDT